ncbi:hypothetical protein A3J41_00285 [candidate division TM6 bacterium RIFCSPHIGHO2_12_FULL_38_8]|nr:MAG: hypothetical protein A3J41_00285 [candidate division TM6 bacterium RIFCSPHIGHO2_12_FULL_38_8]
MNKATDATTTLQEIKEISSKFVHDRDWDKFHSPKDLSMNLSIEAAELMEKFLWISSQDSLQEIEKNRSDIEDEVGDVLFCLLQFCAVAKIDAASAFLQKIEKIGKKYPIETFKGIHTKYDKL